MRRMFGCAVAAAALTLLVVAGAAAQSTDATQTRINQLVERDRPRDLLKGGPFSEDHRRFYADIEKQAKLGHKAAADYRRTSSVRDWRKMLDAVNRGGLRFDNQMSSALLHDVFFALHESGPPTDDPENGGDAAFTARRHHAMMRLLASKLWVWEYVTDAERRLLAGYIDECERRPSALRPSGNNHDRNCGFWFEMTYPPNNTGRAWDEANVPQTLADYAAGLPSPRPKPALNGFLDYPLVRDPAQVSPRYIWAGADDVWRRIYSAPYHTTREYQEQRFAEGQARMAAEHERQQAREAYRLALIPRWEMLWAKQDPTPAERVELEDVSIFLMRLDVYRSRYEIVRYDNIVRFCSLGFTDYCTRKDALDAANRPASAGIGAPSSSQSVTVRSYDQNGNYTGSTTTTRIDAELMGARPN